MSQENVELVRSLVEAWNRDEYSTAKSMDPEIEVEAALGGTFDGIYKGHTGLRRFLEDFWSNFENFSTGVEEYIPAGDDVVLGAHHRGSGRGSGDRGSGRGSGVEVEMRNWQVFTVRHGMIVRYRMFNTKRKALEAAGLRE
jgi:ketosteroid isomerase-like protein